MNKITEEEANEWVRNNKQRHKWVTGKMLSEFANDKIKELDVSVFFQALCPEDLHAVSEEIIAMEDQDWYDTEEERLKKEKHDESN